jgi:hypothetical protein
MTKSSLRFVIPCRSFIGVIGDYSIRSIGPAGGYIFAYSGGKYYEASTIVVGDFAWSNINNVEIGVTAQGTAIGTGQANTLAIINQVGHTSSAAKLCDDLVVTI